MTDGRSITGRFIWHELLTRDVPAAKAFYGKLLGWRMRIQDLGYLGEYAIVHDGDREAAGIGVLNSRWAPSFWTPSVAVDHIADAAKATVFYGGNIIAGPFELPGAGHILQAVDPNGATITFVQPADTTMFGPSRRRVGSFCNHLLTTKETKLTAKYYEALFGWKLKSVDVSQGRKALVFIHERARMATVNVEPDMGKAAYWLCGIGVKNLPAMHQRAVQLGARSLLPPTTRGKLGSFDVLQDPAGASICLYEPSGKKT